VALTNATRTKSKEPRTTLIAITLAAATTMAVTPAFAHCGGSHGKNYRTAQSKKPVASKEVAAKPAVPGVTAIAPANVEASQGGRPDCPVGHRRLGRDLLIASGRARKPDKAGVLRSSSASRNAVVRVFSRRSLALRRGEAWAGHVVRGCPAGAEPGVAEANRVASCAESGVRVDGGPVMMR
jgi:hypothetical protein